MAQTSAQRQRTHWWNAAAARSPDITTLDDFLWGSIKGRLGACCYITNKELGTAVEDAFHTIVPWMLQRMSQRTWRCIRLYVQHQGAHTDPLDMQPRSAQVIQTNYDWYDFTLLSEWWFLAHTVLHTYMWLLPTDMWLYFLPTRDCILYTHICLYSKPTWLYSSPKHNCTLHIHVIVLHTYMWLLYVIVLFTFIQLYSALTYHCTLYLHIQHKPD